MVAEVSSEAWTLSLLPQDRAQTSSDEPVETPELGRHDMLKVAEPSPEHGIEVGDNPPQARPPAAPRLGAHFVLERFQALLAHVSATRLEPVAQEVEPLARLSAIDDPCLVRVEGQALGRRPRLDVAERGPRLVFAPAQDHEVICIAHHPIAAL